MKIELTHTVKHDGRIYTRGDVITADEGLGTYFCSCGWARDISGQAATGNASTETATLDVHSATHKTEVKHG